MGMNSLLGGSHQVSPGLPRSHSVITLELSHQLMASLPGLGLPLSEEENLPLGLKCPTGTQDLPAVGGARTRVYYTQ